jgi:cell division protein FtsL
VRNAYVLRRPVDNVYLVRDRDRRRRRQLLTILGAVTPVGLLLLAYIWTHLHVLEAGYRIDDLGRHLHALTQEERHLQLEVTRLGEPGTIEGRAMAELGMTALDAEHFFLLQEQP